MTSKLANSFRNLLLLLGITAVSSGVPVSAVTLTHSAVGETFEVDWLLPGKDSGSNTGMRKASIDLSAEAEFTVEQFYLNTDKSDRVILDVTLKNTTKLGSSEQSADINRFGFAAAGLTPDIDSFEIRDKDNNGDTDVFQGAHIRTQEQKFSGKFEGINLCVFNNLDNACSNYAEDEENPNPVLAAGKFDNFYLDVYGDFAEGISFSQFPINFHTHEGQFVVEGVEVPEPGMIIALGLFTTSSLLFKRKKANSK